MAAEQQLVRFRQYLAKSGRKYTRQRKVIAEVFFGAKAHHSLAELHALAMEGCPQIGFATVYRTMRLMVKCGLAAEHKFADTGRVRYEPAVDGEHHDHLICVDCGYIIEYEDPQIERLQEQLARGYGFALVGHRHEIYGSCLKEACPNLDPSTRRVGAHLGQAMISGTSQ